MAYIDHEETADNVVEQVRRIKLALAQSMDFDIDRILDDARQKQNEGRRTVLAPPARQSA